ncbi:serine--tRNA ligase [Tenacibaculum finnmarkense genomovar finnmarkense]|uniref:serine--tRNA ligase n=1 Tax=Tenacibaculum finnmarkense TaxID=2781243 RepID=UPI00187B14A1|nr:serine--tRNA ligase [Tenacibaculum finnmarkense]MBE7659568.1 serine--tRNA ligase [Tenacibaculum finnmarkense genomovar finnmarkense]MCD8417094.1 serine--tRNA ligase [Tenacibaculum finnmarkense genomovar finnmarkense]MCG8184513.1 serine--tRNA ligase [Tenacibaculum finnmarkense genomovar finnmarkense]MCG8202026.1 serine--tRNA ligase [Tenacibaculum finnmarkense genomovar finnmarkense]MCG8208781.1 serine--tRNA ligase [Tenacibaculum finnmarkense genomovar finnmarkense]
MLQVQFIRDNKQVVLDGLAKRNFANAETIINQVLTFDETRRATQVSLDNVLAESNKISKEIGGFFKAGEIQKANLLKEKTGQLKEDSKQFTEDLNSISDKLQELLYQIPNIPHASVKAGKSEEDNEKIFSEGIIPDLDENALPHWELAKKYDIIDFELGTKITGAGFPVYKGKGARLQRALINYFLDKNTDAGYKEVQVPHLVNEASGIATGQLPDKEGQMYHSTVDDLYLIPTGEVPITNIHRNDLLKETDLPIKYTGYTPCFRREAGSYGAHVRGLNRLHQFDKVEIVRIEHPDNSYHVLSEMVEHIKDILRDLKLPYRILRLCGGDTGFTSALTFDFELYSTAQERWLEISSASNFETYQANRLKLRFKNKDGKSQLVHTLNGSSLALPRVLAGILENYQTADGIKIPDALVPYCGFDMID